MANLSAAEMLKTGMMSAMLVNRVAREHQLAHAHGAKEEGES